MMISTDVKIEIANRLQDEREALGGWKAVARKVAANEVTVRYNMQDQNKWSLVADKMWTRVGLALGMNFKASEWQYATTNNTQMMHTMLADAQNNAMFLAISHKCGQGKSASCKLYKAQDANQATYYLECKEAWSHKLFMQHLAKTLGIGWEGLTVSGLTDAVVDFFKRRSAVVDPLLILDEAANLSPKSLRLIKPLYNELKGQLGFVIVGADDFETNVLRGVRNNVRGYEELYSRLGGKFMHLFGVLEEDVKAICAANGISDPVVQRAIWMEMDPKREKIDNHYHDMASCDLRRLERLILNRQIQQTRPVPA